MEIVDFNHLNHTLKSNSLWDWGETLEEIGQDFLKTNPHGRTPIWLETIQSFPDIEIDRRNLDSPAITVTTSQEFNRALLEDTLKSLFPWRKGPFDIHGIYIDTEWRSDLKWNRLADKISPLTDRNVLDIGCGSGYHLWRMLGAGARCAIGVDPMRLFVAQFQALRHFIGRDLPVSILPTGIEALPLHTPAFDTIFSMGVLYHRRDPVAHIEQLKSLLLPGGELVLETLIIESPQPATLKPTERYAKMRNVYDIPSISQLEIWLEQAGMQDIQIIDISPTTAEEQRTTAWMPFESLADFLNPHDPTQTIEGHPAPIRAVVVAH